MIDKLDDAILRTGESGPSKYEPLALYVLAMTGADAVAVVVVNGMYGTGGGAAALTADALAQLSPALRVVAEGQAREIEARRAKQAEQPKDVPR